jgi:hypothetical protein
MITFLYQPELGDCGEANKSSCQPAITYRVYGGTFLLMNIDPLLRQPDSSYSNKKEQDSVGPALYQLLML